MVIGQLKLTKGGERKGMSTDKIGQCDCSWASSTGGVEGVAY